MIKKILKHPAFYVLVIYFSLHFINLTQLPIFNDESIYLDWAWSFTRNPGHLFDSLLDAKQPLMIWVFAFFENIFSDPLFAGRFVSVIIGAITLIGVYVVARKLTDKRIALLAASLYSIIPIFVFYNRQALMESAIACAGVWSFYALLNVLRNPTTKNGAILGTILGVGFLIKSSTMLFIVSAFIIILFDILKRKRVELVFPTIIATGVFLSINIILFINPLFWQTVATNSRYAYSLAELSTLPAISWMSHFTGFLEIGVVYLTPLVFIGSIAGAFLLYQNKIKDVSIFLLYFVIALLLEIIIGKSQNQRYLVSYLPFLVMPTAYCLFFIWKKGLFGKFLAGITVVIPIILSLILIINPQYYLKELSKISRYSDILYISGQTSGYGINEVMRYVKENAKPNQPALVLIGLNSGNPENAINLYSSKEPNLFALHMDAKLFPGIENYACLTSEYPTFFITRNNELSGMDRYFDLQREFPNPDGVYKIGIYALKNKCEGVSGSLSYFYNDAIAKISRMKKHN